MRWRQKEKSDGVGAKRGREGGKEGCRGRKSDVIGRKKSDEVEAEIKK